MKMSSKIKTMKTIPKKRTNEDDLKMKTISKIRTTSFRRMYPARAYTNLVVLVIAFVKLFSACLVSTLVFIQL